MEVTRKPMLLARLVRGTPLEVMGRALALIAAIALIDWRIKTEIPLGFLYLFPMWLVGSSLPPGVVAAVALLCTALTEAFDTFEWQPLLAIPRDVLYFAAFFCTGLFVLEVNRSRRVAQAHIDRIQSESNARRDAEEQLQVLVETSPAAIFTVDADGRVLLANGAAHRLFNVAPGALAGSPISRFLPALAPIRPHEASNQSFRTVMQSHGHRASGEAFLADICFSTYRTTAGPRLAAMVLDSSEDLRTREESNLHQLLAGSRILVGAVSHEIRNICAAITVIYQNLSRDPSIARTKDFEALGTLALALERVSSMELRQVSNQASGIDLGSLLEELRIIVEPGLHESDIETEWRVAPDLPAVWADRNSLLQVFLNLIKNSHRAMAQSQRKLLTVTASCERHRIYVEIRDTGCGVDEPGNLFRPFQSGSNATGLGLYLSRAFMRSFRGDLRCLPVTQGAAFVVDLSPAFSESTTNSSTDEQNQPPSDRRSQPVSGGPHPAPASRA